MRLPIRSVYISSIDRHLKRYQENSCGGKINRRVVKIKRKEKIESSGEPMKMAFYGLVKLKFTQYGSNSSHFLFSFVKSEKEILLNRSKFIYKYPFAQFKIFLKINFDQIHMEYIYTHTSV